MPYTDEVDALGIFVPQEGVHVRFESFAYKTFLTGLEVHDKQAVQDVYKRQLDTYGMRYFNVFGRRQDPHGAYAAVIPKFIKQLIDNERPIINGDGKPSRD